MQKAKQQRKRIILNPAPAVPLPEEIYHGLDHLILNESEASMLSGIAEDELSRNFEKVADHFHRRGVDVLVLTLGSKVFHWETIT